MLSLASWGKRRQDVPMTRILIVTTMRNEAPFLLEWLAHHKALGVTDFLIFSNDCDDGTDGLLDQLATHGEVVHVRHSKTSDKSIQWQALKAAWAHPLRKAADWALCIDCDEFVNLRAPFTGLTDLIDAVGDADAIQLPWRFFGHSHHLQFADTPVTERFTRAVPEQVVFPLVTTFFKTLMRVRRGPFAKFGVHRPKTKGQITHPPNWVNGSGQPLPLAFAQNDGQLLTPPDHLGRDWVQLNHYSLRSLEDFLVKRARGLPNHTDKDIDALYWAERNFNTVEDRSIARHAAPMQAELARLRALQGVEEGHQAGVAAHRAKIARLLEDPKQVTFFTRLAMLASSHPPEGEAAQRLLQLTAKAWAKRLS